MVFHSSVPLSFLCSSLILPVYLCLLSMPHLCHFLQDIWSWQTSGSLSMCTRWWWIRISSLLKCWTSCSRTPSSSRPGTPWEPWHNHGSRRHWSQPGLLDSASNWFLPSHKKPTLDIKKNKVFCLFFIITGVWVWNHFSASFAQYNSWFNSALRDLNSGIFEIYTLPFKLLFFCGRNQNFYSARMH